MKLLKGKTIQIRLVEEYDAEFIISLRTNEKYNSYLSSVNDDIAAQLEWIRKYKNDERNGLQYYFIIETLDRVKCGTVRVYDLREDSFCWGSWILNRNKTRYAALESAFLIYEFGFNVLGFSKSHFDVMKGNEKVISFHKKMGAIQVGEDVENYFFEIYPETVANMKATLSSKV